MSVILVIVMAYASVYTASIILIGLMIHYTRNKPLGMQTSLDPASIVIGIATLVMMTMVLINLCIGAFTDGIDYALALMIHLCTVFCFEFLFANWIVHIWHRYLMIFHTAVMMGLTDHNIIKVSNTIKVGMTLLAFCMDGFKNNKKSIGLMYLTKSTYET